MFQSEIPGVNSHRKSLAKILLDAVSQYIHNTAEFHTPSDQWLNWWGDLLGSTGFIRNLVAICDANVMRPTVCLKAKQSWLKQTDNNSHGKDFRSHVNVCLCVFGQGRLLRGCVCTCMHVCAACSSFQPPWSWTHTHAVLQTLLSELTWGGGEFSCRQMSCWWVSQSELLENAAVKPNAQKITNTPTHIWRAERRAASQLWHTGILTINHQHAAATLRNERD